VLHIIPGNFFLWFVIKFCLYNNVIGITFIQVTYTSFYIHNDYLKTYQYLSILKTKEGAGIIS